MKSLLVQLGRRFSQYHRRRRGKLFLQTIKPQPTDLILDLGGADGSYLASIIPPGDNIYVADISPVALERAGQKYGFKTVILNEDGPLPFSDGFFDIVFCSSVIEHVTLPKATTYNVTDTSSFREQAFARQLAFASEIRRISKRYFVQTPYKFFPIESHTWLPFIFVLLPRRWQVAIIRQLSSSGWWPKASQPD